MHRELLLCLLFVCVNGQQKQAQCNNKNPLMANTVEQFLIVGEGGDRIEQTFKCEWTVQPADNKNGKILIYVLFSGAGTADKECIDVTTVPPTNSDSTDRKPKKLCASDGSSKFESTAKTVYLLYPSTTGVAENVPFRVSYQLDTTPLRGKCGPQPELLAEKDPKQFDVGNGAQDLGEDYTCEWTIKSADDKAGKIMISLIGSSGGTHDKECVDVTTVPSTSADRKPTKLCVSGGVSQLEVTQTPAYVVYPTNGAKNVNKPFKVSYQLVTGNAPLTGKCAPQAELMADTETKTLNIGSSAQDIGTGYSCQWTIKPVEGKTGKIGISVVGSNGGTHTNECVDVTTIPPTQTETANRNATKVCAQGDTTSVTLDNSPAYILYPSGNMDSKNKPFNISYQLNSSSRLRFQDLIYLFAAVGLFLQQI